MPQGPLTPHHGSVPTAFTDVRSVYVPLKCLIHTGNNPSSSAWRKASERVVLVTVKVSRGLGSFRNLRCDLAARQGLASVACHIRNLNGTSTGLSASALGRSPRQGVTSLCFFISHNWYLSEALSAAPMVRYELRQL
jgi:hypothetical protein